PSTRAPSATIACARTPPSTRRPPRPTTRPSPPPSRARPPASARLSARRFATAARAPSSGGCSASVIHLAGHAVQGQPLLPRGEVPPELPGQILAGLGGEGDEGAR